MRIIQLTDLHLMADPQAELKGICTRARFDSVWAAVQSRHSAADRLVITGDLTHDEQLVTYETLRGLLGSWHERLRLIPGNHDDRTSMHQVFAQRIDCVAGRNVFVDELGGWRLIGLDSHLPGQVSGQLGRDQLAWLDSQLDASRHQNVCLFVHHPPVTMLSAWLDRVGLQDASELLAAVERQPHVRVVSCGHVHQERSVIAGGAMILTSPSTGVQFRPETDDLEVDVLWPGFRVIDLQPGGGVSTWVERVLCDAR